MKATALAVGLMLITGGGIATARGGFGLGFLAALAGFTLTFAWLTPHTLTRYGGALLGACLLSVLLMPLHRARRGQAPDSSGPSPAMVARPSPRDSFPAAAPETTRSDLSEEAQRAIFQDLRRAEARAKREAIEAHPDGDANTLRLNPEKEMRRTQKRLKVSRALEAQYRTQIAGRHGLTEAQLAAIEREGARNNWPVPSEGTPAATPAAAPGR